MKITKKVTSLLLVMLLALSTFAVAITATAAVPKLPTVSSDSPYKLHIFKYLSYSKTDPLGDSEIGNSDTIDGTQKTVDTKYKPVANITFKVTRVGNLTDAVKDQDAAPTAAANGLKLGESTNVTTGTNGEAIFNITDETKLGLYYVEEVADANADNDGYIATRCKPFYVYLPMTNAAGDDWLSEVYVYPKNVYTTNAGAAYKTIDLNTYSSRLEEFRIYDGAEIELHREDKNYEPAKQADGSDAKNETVIARFTLASTSFDDVTGDVDTEGDQGSTGAQTTGDAKDGNDGAPNQLNYASVQIAPNIKSETAKAQYASNPDGGSTDVTTATVSNKADVTNKLSYKAVATIADDQISESESGKLGEEFANLEAIVTNDGRMIVNGLPAGTYHWFEKSFTKLYAAEARSDGSGLENNYALWRKCNAVDSEQATIGDHKQFTIKNTDKYGAYQLESQNSSVSGIEEVPDTTVAENSLNHIENTVGIQVDKETVIDSTSGQHEGTFVPNDEEKNQGTDSEAKFDYSVGDYVPYRLDVKLPADTPSSLKAQASATEADYIKITDTLSTGLTLQNDNSAFKASKIVNIPNEVDNGVKDTIKNPDSSNDDLQDINRSPYVFMLSYAEVKTDGSGSATTAAGHVNVTKEILNPVAGQGSGTGSDEPLIDVKVDGQTTTFTIKSTESYKKLMTLFDKIIPASVTSVPDKEKWLSTKALMIEIYYDAMLNEKAVVSTEKDTFSDSNGNINTLKFDTTTTGEKAYVFTGGAKLVKVDASTVTGTDYAGATTKIGGAKYQVFKGNFTDKKSLESLTPIKFKDNSGSKYVRCADQNSEDGVTDLVTAEGTGLLDISGLEFGDYTLVEVYSPEAYELNNKLTNITINDTSYAATRTDDYLVDVPETKLPLTGGIGTIIFTVVGLALIGGAAFFFIRSRRNKEDEA